MSEDTHSAQQQILQQLTNISQRLDVMEAKISTIEQSTQNMDHHISFVENVYQKCRSPFFTLMNMVSNFSLTNGESNDLPLLENH